MAFVADSLTIGLNETKDKQDLERMMTLRLQTLLIAQQEGTPATLQFTLPTLPST